MFYQKSSRNSETMKNKATHHTTVLNKKSPSGHVQTKDNMGIICSTDDTQNWTKTFKGNEAEDPYNNVSFSEPAPSNPYDQGPRPSLLTSNYYPPPQTTSNAANEARGASAHPRAY